MNILESLVVFAALGSLLIITIPYVRNYLWHRSYNAGFADGKANADINHHAVYRGTEWHWFAGAYGLGYRHGNTSKQASSLSAWDWGV